ncbi:MAG: twin-arginine translocase TatA/TatE family subunit [Alphaproteobacteria bacterium]|jgi:sec-independent protein translocase protein TatA|nr:twin-arginine translocase TatA/TatE family subunit [Alphaproteobacteria bacterium]MBT4710022.1 twin-arginine translocase TatA/TatE family subunit [Alphaproteobacteria bacterium]MBT5860794.1 twin-arginine translocase TatA/TatE family subunit [Alphaproteobacteria bacterium]
MGTFSIWHWMIVLAVVLLLFGGRGKISGIMGDFGSGLKAFKKQVKEDDVAEGDKDKIETETVTSESEESSTKKETAKG